MPSLRSSSKPKGKTPGRKRPLVALPSLSEHTARKNSDEKRKDYTLADVQEELLTRSRIAAAEAVVKHISARIHFKSQSTGKESELQEEKKPSLLKGSSLPPSLPSGKGSNARSASNTETISRPHPVAQSTLCYTSKPSGPSCTLTGRIESGASLPPSSLPSNGDEHQVGVRKTEGNDVDGRCVQTKPPSHPVGDMPCGSGDYPLVNEPLEVVSEYLQQVVQDVLEQMTAPISAAHYARHVLLINEMLYQEAVFGFTPCMILGGVAEIVWLMAERLMEGKLLISPFHPHSSGKGQGGVFSNPATSLLRHGTAGMTGEHRVAMRAGGTRGVTTQIGKEGQPQYLDKEGSTADPLRDLAFPRHGVETYLPSHIQKPIALDQHNAEDGLPLHLPVSPPFSTPMNDAKVAFAGEGHGSLPIGETNATSSGASTHHHTPTPPSVFFTNHPGRATGGMENMELFPIPSPARREGLGTAESPAIATPRAAAASRPEGKGWMGGGSGTRIGKTGGAWSNQGVVETHDGGSRDGPSCRSGSTAHRVPPVVDGGSGGSESTKESAQALFTTQDALLSLLHHCELPLICLTLEDQRLLAPALELLCEVLSRIVAFVVSDPLVLQQRSTRAVLPTTDGKMSEVPEESIQQGSIKQSGIPPSSSMGVGGAVHYPSSSTAKLPLTFPGTRMEDNPAALGKRSGDEDAAAACGNKLGHVQDPGVQENIPKMKSREAHSGEKFPLSPVTTSSSSSILKGASGSLRHLLVRNGKGDAKRPLLASLANGSSMTPSLGGLSVSQHEETTKRIRLAALHSMEAMLATYERRIDHQCWEKEMEQEGRRRMLQQRKEEEKKGRKSKKNRSGTEGERAWAAAPSSPSIQLENSLFLPLPKEGFPHHVDTTSSLVVQQVDLQRHEMSELLVTRWEALLDYVPRLPAPYIPDGTSGLTTLTEEEDSNGENETGEGCYAAPNTQEIHRNSVQKEARKVKRVREVSLHGLKNENAKESGKESYEKKRNPCVPPPHVRTPLLDSSRNVNPFTAEDGFLQDNTDSEEEEEHLVNEEFDNIARGSPKLGNVSRRDEKEGKNLSDGGAEPKQRKKHQASLMPSLIPIPPSSSSSRGTGASSVGGVVAGGESSTGDLTVYASTVPDSTTPIILFPQRGEARYEGEEKTRRSSVAGGEGVDWQGIQEQGYPSQEIAGGSTPSKHLVYPSLCPTPRSEKGMTAVGSEIGKNIGGALGEEDHPCHGKGVLNNTTPVPQGASHRRGRHEQQEDVQEGSTETNQQRHVTRAATKKDRARSPFCVNEDDSHFRGVLSSEEEEEVAAILHLFIQLFSLSEHRMSARQPVKRSKKSSKSYLLSGRCNGAIGSDEEEERDDQEQERLQELPIHPYVPVLLARTLARCAIGDYCCSICLDLFWMLITSAPEMTSRSILYDTPRNPVQETGGMSSEPLLPTATGARIDTYQDGKNGEENITVQRPHSAAKAPDGSDPFLAGTAESHWTLRAASATENLFQVLVNFLNGSHRQEQREMRNDMVIILMALLRANAMSMQSVREIDPNARRSASSPSLGTPETPSHPPCAGCEASPTSFLQIHSAFPGKESSPWSLSASAPTLSPKSYLLSNRCPENGQGECLPVSEGSSAGCFSSQMHSSLLQLPIPLSTIDAMSAASVLLFGLLCRPELEAAKLPFDFDASLHGSARFSPFSYGDSSDLLGRRISFRGSNKEEGAGCVVQQLNSGMKKNGKENDACVGNEISAANQQLLASSVAHGMATPYLTFVTQNILLPYALRFHGVSSTVLRRDNLELKRAGWQFLVAFCNWQAVHIYREKLTIELLQLACQAEHVAIPSPTAPSMQPYPASFLANKGVVPPLMSTYDGEQQSSSPQNLDLQVEKERKAERDGISSTIFLSPLTKTVPQSTIGAPMKMSGSGVKANELPECAPPVPPSGGGIQSSGCRTPSSPGVLRPGGAAGLFKNGYVQHSRSEVNSEEREGYERNEVDKQTVRTESMVPKKERSEWSSASPSSVAPPPSSFQDGRHRGPSVAPSSLEEPKEERRSNSSELLNHHQAAYESYLLVNLFHYGLLDVLMMYSNVYCENLVVLQWTTEEMLILQEESWRLIDTLVRSAEQNRRRCGSSMANPEVHIEILRSHRLPLWKHTRCDQGEGRGYTSAHDNVACEPSEVFPSASVTSNSDGRIGQGMVARTPHQEDYYPADVFWIALDGVQCALTYLTDAPSSVEKMKFLVISLLASVSRSSDLEVQRSLVQSAPSVIPLLTGLLEKLLTTVKCHFAPKDPKKWFFDSPEGTSMGQRTFTSTTSKRIGQGAHALTQSVSTWSSIPPSDKIQFLVMSCFSLLQNIGEASWRFECSSESSVENGSANHHVSSDNMRNAKERGSEEGGGDKTVGRSFPSEPPNVSSSAVFISQHSPLSVYPENSPLFLEPKEVAFINKSPDSSTERDVPSQNSLPRSICSASSSELHGCSPEMRPASQHFYDCNGILQLIAWAEYILFPNPVKAQSLFIVALAKNPGAASSISQPPLIENELFDNLDLIILLLSTIKSLVLRIKKNEKVLLEANGVAIMMHLIEALAIAADALPPSYMSYLPCILRDRTVEVCLPLRKNGKTVENIRHRAFHNGLQYALSVLSDFLLSCPEATPRFLEWHSRFLQKSSEVGIGAPLHESPAHNYFNAPQLLLALWEKDIASSSSDPSGYVDPKLAENEKNLQMGLRVLNIDMRNINTLVLRQEYVRRLLRRRVRQRLKQIQAKSDNKVSSVARDFLLPSTSSAVNSSPRSSSVQGLEHPGVNTSHRISLSKLSPASVQYDEHFTQLNEQASCDTSGHHSSSGALNKEEESPPSYVEVMHPPDGSRTLRHPSVSSSACRMDPNANATPSRDSSSLGTSQDEEDEALVTSHISRLLSIPELLNYYKYVFGSPSSSEGQVVYSEREIISQMYSLLEVGAKESAAIHEYFVTKAIYEAHGIAVKVFSCFSAIGFEKLIEIPSSPQERAHLIAVAAFPALFADEVCVSMMEVAQSSALLSKTSSDGKPVASTTEMKLEGSISFINPPQIDFSNAVPMQLTTPDRRCLSSLMEDVKIRTHELLQLFLIGKKSDSAQTRELYNRYLITRLKQPVGIASLWEEYNQFRGTSSTSAFECVDAKAKPTVPPISPLQVRRYSQLHTPFSAVFSSPTYGINITKTRAGPRFPVSRRSTLDGNLLGDVCPPAQLASSAMIHAELQEAEDLHQVRQETYPEKVYQPSQGENFYICSPKGPSVAMDAMPRRKFSQEEEGREEMNMDEIDMEKGKRRCIVENKESCEEEGQKVFSHPCRKTSNSFLHLGKGEWKETKENVEMEQASSHSCSAMLYVPITTTPSSMGFNIALYHEHQRGNVNMVPSVTLLEEGKVCPKSTERSNEPDAEQSGVRSSGVNPINVSSEPQAPLASTARPAPSLLQEALPVHQERIGRSSLPSACLAGHALGGDEKASVQMRNQPTDEKHESSFPGHLPFDSESVSLKANKTTLSHSGARCWKPTVPIHVGGLESASLPSGKQCNVPFTLQSCSEGVQTHDNSLVVPRSPEAMAAVITTGNIFNTEKHEEPLPHSTYAAQRGRPSHGQGDAKAGGHQISCPSLGGTGIGKGVDQKNTTDSNTLIVTWPARPKSSIALKHLKREEMIKNSLKIPAPYPTAGKGEENNGDRGQLPVASSPPPGASFPRNEKRSKEEENCTTRGNGGGSGLAPFTTKESKKVIQNATTRLNPPVSQPSIVSPFSALNPSVGSYFSSTAGGCQAWLSSSQPKKPPHHLPGKGTEVRNTKQHARLIVDKVMKAANYAEPTLVRTFPLDASAEHSSDDDI